MTTHLETPRLETMAVHAGIAPVGDIIADLRQALESLR